MPSIIPGYEYDVFISYRQKDNKRDKWVTEFVDSLRSELEATFKENISIYFDENPHDGLLETYDVDDSLKDKLKCLIFIPIVSQTYCDPNCFAWKSEFLAFKRYASEDSYGLKVRLPNGNVTSRILPVRIHDLDAADRQLLEGEIGMIRSVDFIFKSAGVNRALRAKDDELREVSKPILYRDQMNKVANAMKEIIQGLKNFDTPVAIETKNPKFESSIFKDIGKSTSIKSIAVLPFTNSDNDPEVDYLSEGLTDNIYVTLSTIRDLKVASRSVASFWKGEQVDFKLAGEKLGVSTILKGGVSKSGNELQITVTLLNTNDGTVRASLNFDLAATPVFHLPIEVANTIIKSLGLVVKEHEKKALESKAGYDPVAYDLYLHGKYFLKKGKDGLLKGLHYFKDAVARDSQFALAYCNLAHTYILLGYYKLISFDESISQSKENAMKALQLDPTLTEAYNALAFISMSYEWNWPEAEQNFRKIFAINPNSPNAGDRYQLYLTKVNAIFEEAESESVITLPYFLGAYALLHQGRFDEALEAGLKAVQQDSNSFMAHRAVGLSYMGLEKFDKAIEYLHTASSLSNQHYWILFELMGAYLQAGKKREALNILEEAQANANIIPARIVDFYRFGEEGK